MKNQKSRKLSYTLIVAMLFASITLSAQQMRRGGGENHPQQFEQKERGQRGLRDMEERGPKGPRIPNLTEEQKEQLHGFRIEMEKEALPLHNSIGEKEAQLKTLTTSDNYNSSAVENLIEDIGEVKTELEKLKAGQIPKIKSILTDEQLVAFNKEIAHGQKKGPKKGQRRR
jgi:Spy/CpxP family protein refolding chaperone